MLSRDEILANIQARKNMKVETIDVPEWGGVVYLRTMSAGERDAFEASCMVLGENGDKAKQDLTNFRAKLVSKCVVDETGNRIFTDDHIPELALEAATVIDPIFGKCQSLNAMTKDDVEKLAKN